MISFFCFRKSLSEIQLPRKSLFTSFFYHFIYCARLKDIVKAYAYRHFIGWVLLSFASGILNCLRFWRQCKQNWLWSKQ